MKACGLVVEYNPFHHGHLYHLQEAKKITNSDITVAIMSGSFLQRGEPAIIDKYHRTRAALEAGVDLVLELPYAYAVQSSALFAKGALLSLEALNVTSICFGSELGEITPFNLHIKQLKAHEQTFNEIVQNAVRSGIAYPKAISDAYKAIGLTSHHVTKPNNILGFHYLKTILDHDLSIEPYTIKRIANDYHTPYISGPIASATSIRNTLLQGDSAEVEQALPHASLQMLRQYYKKTHVFHHWESYFPSLYYKVMTSQLTALSHIHLIEEGLENRIQNKIDLATSFEDFLYHLSTSRYTRARLQRSLTHILTNTTKEEISAFHEDDIPYIRLLGMNKRGQAYIHQEKKQLDLPLLSRLNRSNASLLEMEERATKVYYSILPPLLRKKMFQQELKLPIIL